MRQDDTFRHKMPEENNNPKKRESGNKGKHTNRALAHYRITQIYNELKLMKSNTDIRTKFSEEWGVSPRTVDTYIKKANRHMCHCSRTLHAHVAGYGCNRICFVIPDGCIMGISTAANVSTP